MNSIVARIVLRAAILISVVSSASSSEIYWTSSAETTNPIDAIRRADSSTLVQETIIPSGLRWPYRIAADTPTGQLFWTSLSTTGGYGGIRRANLDGSNIQQIVPGTSSSTMTIALAVDSVHQKILFSQGVNRLKKANFDGSNVETYPPIASDTIQDIAFDSINNVIYYSDYDGSGEWGSTGRLCRINYDGSGYQVIASGISLGPVGVSVDPVGGKLYWGSAGIRAGLVGALQRANLDGSGIETIVPNQDVDSLSLDILAGKIYWSDNDNSESLTHVWRSNLDGSGREQLPFAEPAIMGITIVPEPATLALLVAGLLVHRRRAAAS